MREREVGDRERGGDYGERERELERENKHRGLRERVENGES